MLFNGQLYIQNVIISYHTHCYHPDLCYHTTSNIDDCNTLLIGFPAQSILNTATFLKLSDHINPLLKILQ